MPTEVASLTARLDPKKTILLFVSGSSIPSNAPSVATLKAHFERCFGVSSRDYSLAEQTSIIEHTTKDRQRLISELRAQFKGVNPTGSLLNLPLYNWKVIFTTNYDELIEACYKRRGRPYSVYSSNFDFGLK